MEARVAYEPKPSDETQAMTLLGEKGETLSTAALKEKITTLLAEEDAWANNVAISELCGQYLGAALKEGQKPGDPDYEQAISWCLETINTAGRFAERPGSMTRWQSINRPLIQAAYQTALLGDSRLRDQRFFAFLPLWNMHQLQPWQQIDPDNPALDAITGSLMLQSALYPSPDIKWWLDNVPPEPIATPLLATVELAEAYSPPPTFGLYPQAAVMFWRSSWASGADGLVARGSITNAPESSENAGHVSWTAHGNQVLIRNASETKAFALNAQPDESETRTPQKIPPGNVLRVGDATPQPGRATLIVRELNAIGGNLRIDASDDFLELSLWHRDLFWTVGGEFRIIDTVRYDFGERDRTSFYWHLSASEPVKIETSRKRTIVEWDDNAIVFQGNTPLDVDQFLIPGADGGAPHVVLCLRTIGRPHSLRLLTRVLPRETSAMKEIADSGSAKP